MGAGVSQSGALAPAGTSIGVGGDSGSQHSVTSAGISGVAGDKTVRTGDAPTGVAKIFDAARVEQDVGAQVFIMQTFTREAPRAIARYADTQVQDLLKQAGSETDLDKQALLRSEAAHWAEGGTYRVALHAATGAVAGGLEGALGAGTVAAAAPLLNDWQRSLTANLQAAGVTASVAQATASLITGTAAAGIGAVVSGGSVPGAVAGVNVDANNRQLHREESKFIDKKSKELAAQTCKAGDAECASAAQRYWSDQLTAEAEATDDSKLAQQRQAYLKQVAATGQVPGLEGQTSGGAAKYLDDAQIARNALSEIRGQKILGSDGKPIVADGWLLTYFGGTQAQRDDHNLYAVRPGPYDNRVSGNGSANNIVPQQDGMLRSGRDASRLENLRATNGVVLPDYPVESFVVGGGVQAAKDAGKAAVGFVERSLTREATITTTVATGAKGVGAAASDALRVGEYQYTRTAGNHINDIVTRGEFKGELSRPYINSPSTINEIVGTSRGVPDPGGIPGALRYDVPGTFRGSQGTWELVVHPESKTIYHFLFKFLNFCLYFCD